MPPLTGFKATFRCLDGVELDFRSPEDGAPAPFVALVGANGAGKTSILEAIARTIHAARIGDDTRDFLLRDDWEIQLFFAGRERRLTADRARAPGSSITRAAPGTRSIREIDTKQT